MRILLPVLAAAALLATPAMADVFTAGRGHLLELGAVQTRGPMVNRIFQAAGMTTDGAPSNATFSQLSLFADGNLFTGRPSSYLTPNAPLIVEGLPFQYDRGLLTLADL